MNITPIHSIISPIASRIHRACYINWNKKNPRVGKLGRAAVAHLLSFGAVHRIP